MRKIKKVLIFIGVFIVSFVTSGLLSYGVARIFFSSFFPNVPGMPIAVCPIPIPVGCGLPGYSPAIINTYPHNILMGVFAMSFVFGVIFYSLLAVKILFKH